MESIDVPTALEHAFKGMINNEYLKDLLHKLDEWLECSCEQVYHYTLRYYLDELLPKSVSIKDERTLNQIFINKSVPKKYKKRKVDIYASMHQGETEAFIEIKMGKMNNINISESNFEKLYSNDLDKLAFIKNEKGKNCRCFLLKITHDINNVKDNGKLPDKYRHINGYELTYEKSYGEKAEILEKIYNEYIVNKFSNSKFKLKFIADSRNLENNIFIYHLWEVVEK